VEQGQRHLGQWTGLTRLALLCKEWPAGLPGQLKQLTALDESRLEVSIRLA
jgi:hypothetical protein